MAARTKADIAEELENASTWLSGTRARKLLALAAELRGEQAPAPTEQEKRDAERAEARKASPTAPVVVPNS